MRFSILGVVSASWALTLQHLGKAYLSLLFYIGGVFALAIGAAILMLIFSLIPGLKSVAAVVIMVITIFGAGVIMAGIFNYWVRLAALGADRAIHTRTADFLKAASINLVKFGCIILLLLVAYVVVASILSLAGLTGTIPVMMPADGETPTFARFIEMYAQSVTPGQIAMQLITLSVSCVIYSFFSANLTGTALGDEREGLEHPHTIDFAIALLLIDAMVVVPCTLLLLAGFPVVSIILNIVVSFPLIAAISIAHGIRYRMCLSERNTSWAGESV